jgi:hypothetical protein
MLAGRCSCASSLFPIPPSKHENPLSPFFPLHTQIPPVSPLLPLDTKMRGGGVPAAQPPIRKSSTLFNFFQPNPCICFSFLFAPGGGGATFQLRQPSQEGASIFQLSTYHAWSECRHSQHSRDLWTMTRMTNDSQNRLQKDRSPGFRPGFVWFRVPKVAPGSTRYLRWWDNLGGHYGDTNGVVCYGELCRRSIGDCTT